MNRPFLSIRDIRKTFGTVVAVENVSIEIPRGGPYRPIPLR